MSNRIAAFRAIDQVELFERLPVPASHNAWSGLRRFLTAAESVTPPAWSRQDVGLPEIARAGQPDMESRRLRV